MVINQMHGKRVFVGISGGVDSAVSAALLKKAGYHVTGVFIKVWQPDWIECNWQEERRDAMRVAAHLDIPFITLDLETEYKKGVIDYMIAEYRAGRTPNPDVMCNKTVKFGAFYDWAMKQGADFVATGHYARIKRETGRGKSQEGCECLDGGTFGGAKAPRRNARLARRDMCPTGKYSQPSLHLYAGNDRNKDQSYFIWNIKHEQLAHILFPIGDIQKTEVRKLARKFGLPNAEKKDSQGLCFIGKIDFKEFLQHYMKTEKGNVLNEQGEVIGTHNGALFFTIGERHGFSIDDKRKSANDKPYFVIEKDVEQNTIIVSNKDKRELLPSATKVVRLEKVNWIDGEVPDFGVNSGNAHYLLLARSRYRQELQKVRIESSNITETVLEFESPQDTLTPGQSLVVYDGERCLGGGVIV
ncbi:MAG: tRNA 2-thiouridine(34) synthase MnmA [Candidatus Taylorbacteria bacterium]